MAAGAQASGRPGAALCALRQLAAAVLPQLVGRLYVKGWQAGVLHRLIPSPTMTAQAEGSSAAFTTAGTADTAAAGPRAACAAYRAAYVRLHVHRHATALLAGAAKAVAAGMDDLGRDWKDKEVYEANAEDLNTAHVLEAIASQAAKSPLLEFGGPDPSELQALVRHHYEVERQSAEEAVRARVRRPGSPAGGMSLEAVEMGDEDGGWDLEVEAEADDDEEDEDEDEDEDSMEEEEGEGEEGVEGEEEEEEEEEEAVEEAEVEETDKADMKDHYKGQDMGGKSEEVRLAKEEQRNIENWAVLAKLLQNAREVQKAAVEVAPKVGLAGPPSEENGGDDVLPPPPPLMFQVVVPFCPVAGTLC